MNRVFYVNGILVKRNECSLPEFSTLCYGHMTISNSYSHGYEGLLDIIVVLKKWIWKRMLNQLVRKRSHACAHFVISVVLFKRLF